VLSPIARTVARESHRAGVPVLIHATELRTAKLALRAGADVLVHSVTDPKVDEEFLRLACERKAINSRNHEVFLSVYHPRVEVYDFPSGTLRGLHPMQRVELSQLLLFEMAAGNAGLSNNRHQGPPPNDLVIRNRYGHRCGGRAFLHHHMASPLSHPVKPMFPQNLTDLAPGQDLQPTQRRSPPW